MGEDQPTHHVHVQQPNQLTNREPVRWVEFNKQWVTFADRDVIENGRLLNDSIMNLVQASSISSCENRWTTVDTSSTATKYISFSHTKASNTGCPLPKSKALGDCIYH